MTQHHPRKHLDQLMDWARDYRTSRLVTTAVETGILERFQGESATAEDIIEETDDPEGLRRFLQAFAALGLLKKVGEGFLNPPG